MSIIYKPIKELPKPRRARKSDYEEIIEKFLDDKTAKYAEISREGVKSVSLASALRRIIKQKDLSDKVTVRVIGGKVYLAKKSS